MCEQETMAFEKKYGIKTSFIRGGTGTILAKIDAEKDNPQGDVWYGGTLDPHSQAGEMGLLEAYKSPNLAQIPEQFRDPAKIKGNYSSAIYLGVLGFGINPERLKNLIYQPQNVGKISLILLTVMRSRRQIRKVQEQVILS